MGAQRMLDDRTTGRAGASAGTFIGFEFFYYVRDPWGAFAGYFHDLDYIPEQCAWEPRDFPAEDADLPLGPALPEDFGLNRELEN